MLNETFSVIFKHCALVVISDLDTETIFVNVLGKESRKRSIILDPHRDKNMKKTTTFLRTQHTVSKLHFWFKKSILKRTLGRNIMLFVLSFTTNFSCLFTICYEFQLFIYSSALCLQFSSLFTIQLFVYISAICLQISNLFTFQLFVYNSTICLQFSYLFTFQLFVFN